MLCFPSVKQTAPARCLGMATVSLLGDAEKPRALPSVESCAFPSPQSQCGMLSLRKPSPFSRGDPASWSCAWVQPAGLISELPSSKCRGQMTLGTSVPGAGTWACSALCSSPWEMRMILQARMSELVPGEGRQGQGSAVAVGAGMCLVGSWCCSPAAGAQRIWCWGCPGPCPCCGHLEEQKVPWSEFPRELWLLVPILAAAVAH